jgi:tetratricopeptide (TPR) repeat protein
MTVRRPVFIAVIVLICAACASRPAEERPPRDLRLSIRHLNKGARFYNKGCFPKAARHFQEAYERFAAADNIAGSADSLNSLANTYYRLNDMQSAAIVYDEAVELYALLDKTKGQVRALTNKSVALASVGKLMEARKALDAADALAGPKEMLVNLRLKARGILRFENNDLDGSKQLLSKAIRSIAHSKDPQYASTQYTMGHVLLSDQQPEKAMAYLNRALASDRDTGDYFGIGQDLEALGDCHALLGQHAHATTRFKRSIKIFALLNNIEKVQQVSSKLVESASQADTDAQTTLNWVAKWLAGQWEANICR